MTLDEMDARLAEEDVERAERAAKLRKWAASQNLHTENPYSRIGKSFFCENNHHADCRWDACKCVCHDSTDWGGYAC